VLGRFPRAALSRGLAGVRGRTLIINLPGSPGGVADGLDVMEQWIEHAVDLVRGEKTEHDARTQGRKDSAQGRMDATQGRKGARTQGRKDARS